MALSGADTAKVQDAIAAVDAWAEAEIARLESTATFLKSIDIGTRTAVSDGVESAVDEASALIADLLGE